MSDKQELATRLGSSLYGPPVLAWADLETTGLNTQTDEIIEIAVIVTNNQLDEIDRYEAVVAPTPGAYIRMMNDPFLVDMHTKNGLLAALADTASTVLVADAERAVMGMLTRHGIPLDEVILSVCGSGVSNHDIPILRNQMPTFMGAASYFSATDVGVLRRSFGMWNGYELVHANDSKTHRALDDIECHLAEGRAFKQLLTANTRCLDAANMWRTQMENDPEALTGINSILTACHAIATASGNADDMTPELDLNKDGIAMLHGAMLLNLYLLEQEAARTGTTLAGALNSVQNHFVDKQQAA